MNSMKRGSNGSARNIDLVQPEQSVQAYLVQILQLVDSLPHYDDFRRH